MTVKPVVQKKHTTPRKLLAGSLVCVLALIASLLAIVGVAVSTVSAAATHFTPTITITVPQFDDDSNDINDFSGAAFEVTFAASAAAGAGCTQRVTSTITIGDDGQSTPNTVSLVDSPIGNPELERCNYDITFPLPTGFRLLSPRIIRLISATASTASATYGLFNTTFQPMVTIAVPDLQDNTAGVNDYSGTTFRVTFTPVLSAHAMCTQRATSTLTIGGDGSSSVTSSVTLFDRPAGVTERCEYDVTFPDFVPRSGLAPLLLQPGHTATITATDTATATYFARMTTFTSTVTINVPQTQDLVAGINDYSGDTFDVTFTPVASSDAGCTQTATSTATIGSNGQSTAPSVSLVDRPSGVTARCQYDVAFPTVAGLVLLAGSTATVSATVRAAIANYVLPTTSTFAPTITINVPDIDGSTVGVNAYTGTEFMVVFTRVSGSDSSCTVTVTSTVTIGNDGQSTATSVSLVDRPTGVTARCEYDVAFPTTAGLTIQLGATATVSATSLAASATYLAGTVFIPTVRIEVPLFDDDEDDANDYSGTEFDVTFTPVASSDAGCAQTATATVTIGDDGASSVTTPVSLVDRPSGVTARCQYDVEFPDVTGLELRAGSTATVSATARNASAVYFASTSSFTPTIAIAVPQFDDDSNDINDFSSTTFDVTFTRVFLANTGCTQTATATVTIGDDGASSVTTPVSLVDRPIGVTARCQYVLTFPTVAGLELQRGWTAIVSAAAPAATATYFESITRFTPTVTIVVPLFDDDSNDINDFSGTSFRVTFRRASGHGACTSSRTIIARIGDDGTSSITRTGTLTDRRPGVTARCQYDVFFPPNVAGLTLQAGFTATVSPDSPAATATYFTPTSNFTPTVTITVPDIDDNVAGTNDYSGTEFDVTFTRVSGANAGCTQTATSTATIGDDGGTTATDVMLVDRPTGITARCQYDVEFPDVAGLELQTGSTATVTATSLAATATYFAPASSFTPTVTITVPDIDDNVAGTNDYSGTEFDVTFTRVSGANAGCTQTATSTATIGDNGQSTATDVMLVDRPTGVTARCQYDVAFPDVAGLVLQTGSTATVTATSLAATATYFAPASSFTPTVTINVPQTDDNVAGTNDYSGTEFDVTFTRVSGANAGCTATATSTATIGDNGQSTATDVMLVDRPTGVTARCEYDVAFPSATGLVLQAGSTATVTATALAATATYFSSFVPTITINVPQTDDDTAGTNDYSGTEFDVTFTRVSGANAGCTQTATSTVTIGDNGQSTATTISLVDRPTGVTARCEYDVAFPSATGLVMQAGSTATVTATALAATATYFAPTTNFTPTITITVPDIQDNTPGTNDYSGTTFDVTFTPVANSDAGCTQTATATVTIGDNGQSTATDVTLVDRPTGVTARCQYNVAFPAATGLVLQAGSTATVTATALATTATYWATTTNFTPTITITVPQFDDDSNDINDFSDTEFMVAFTPVADSDAGCTQTATATVTIGDNGQSTVTTAVSLVDRPTGITDRCEYDVTFSTPAEFVLQAGSTATVTATAAAASAVYRASLTSFSPAIEIAVPQFDDDGNNVKDYSGATFRVTFDRVSGADTSCTQSAAVTIEIGDDGASSVASSGTLVDRPTGVTARCEYDVTFPARVVRSGFLPLLLQPGATATVTAADTAMATYFVRTTNFTPTITIGVPDIQDTTPGTSDYTGTEFDVTFTPVADSDAGCTQTATATVTIGDNGASSVTTTVSLVDRPTGVTARCQYDVEFPTATGLVLQAGSTATVSATALAASATYWATTTNFTPTITITVPDIQDTTPGTSDYTGTEFDVTFTPVADSDAGCTQTATATVTIGDNGTSSVTTTVSLVDRPTGVTARCQYDVEFPTATGLVLQAGSTATVSATALAASATYWATTTNFTPTITITVPDIDDNTPGTNDYTGTEFMVTFTRVTGANAGCTASATSTATIGDDGGTTATTINLVDRPTGVTARCQYDVAFPSATGLVLQAGFTATVSATALAATATYWATTTNFTPTITITVPDIQDTTPGTNDFSGTRFSMTFTRVTGANAGCTASATSTATIGDDGSTRATAVNLVDRPTGVTARCEYDVAFPSAIGLMLVLQAGATATVSATALAATATYFALTSRFTPTVTITVPDIQDTTPGTNDYTGTEFMVMFTRVTGANAGCTASATSTATIGDDGGTTATTINLVDRPTGVTARCQYDVAFPSATGLALQAGSTATVSATALAASATYWATTTNFTPTITITVPDIQDTTAGTNDYTGTEFMVMFTRVTGANAGCTESATSTATIGDDGGTTATTINLVDRPTGVTARCQYDVAFPSATGLALQAGSTATVSATALAASATYFALTSRFTPTVTITVPDIDDTTAGTSDYSGTEFMVMFTRVSGANAGCTASATSTATIGDDGGTTATTINLVDRPTGVTARCQYDVAFPSATGLMLVLQAGATATVSATALAATATYFALTSRFTPTVTITVPDIDDNVAGTNDYSGTEFMVMFTRVSGANAGCTASATSTATIGDDGGTTATTINLVDRPTGVTARCQYDVAFPSATGLVLQAGFTATVSATALAATATYWATTSNFTPTITITVPDIQDNTPGTSDYSGTEFMVMFTRVSGANAGCTASATSTATIGDDGGTTATTINLVDRPTGVTARCQYDVAFPTVAGLVLQAGSTATVSATALAATATYWATTSNFTPTITITVPDIQDNTPGTNDYTGTEFMVTFTRVTGANAGCTATATSTATIGDNGGTTATTINLVDRPTGVTARCQYDVAFPSATGLALQAGSTATVSATALAATATYWATTTNFTPTITITVPDIQDNTPGTSDYTGTEFIVMFTPVANSNAGCTQTATSTATIGDNGQSTATTIMLVDRPTGVTDRCEYDAEFPTSVDDLTLQTGSATVSATSATAAATYFTADSSFSPTVAISVPQTQDNTPGTNDYSGTTFDVTFTRVTGANAGCTATATSTATIGDNGQSTATTIMLVDRPTGVIARCQYDVAFPTGERNLVLAATGLVLQAGATATVSATALAASATYFAPVSSFTPTITITVPDIDDTTAGTNDYTGTEFDVTFTRVTGANAGCTATATSTATIGDNGQSTATDVSLVDRPTGVTARCEYDVAFPTATGLVLQAGFTATVSATALAASATYFAPVSSFTPTITITVPDIDDTTAGTNDYTGTEFDVTFTRVTGANAGCTASATSTATIGDNGQSTATDVSLVDRPTGVTARCEYDVAFPTATGLVLQAGATATVSATALAASATYFAPTTNFTPTVTIMVPDIDDGTAGTNDYTGTTFDVTFTRVTGANAGCTASATSTATIGDNGQSTASTIMLVDRPTGVTARCQYDVAFPTAAGLVLQAGSTATVSATALAASATYFAPTTNFTPTVTIMVPDIDDGTAGTNDYTGTTFDVTFTRVTGANAGCTQTATSTATIGDNGQSTATTITLVDRPTGITARCQYDVAFPTATGLALQAGSTATVSATALAASATYFAPTTNFTPTVTITVPDIQDTTPGTNDFSGTTFDVTFTRVTGANAGCTQTATSTATIGDNGQSTASTIMLVDRPTGVTTRCEYDVEFPTSVDDLTLQTGSATVSATSATAAATYFTADSSFSPTIAISVPQTQDNTPGTNDFSGTTFDVTFTPVASSNAGCTQTATSTATISDDGQSTATTITLIDRPTGVTARCQYDVAFPTAAGLVLQAGSTATVSATALAASATYFAPVSSFTPTITINVPDIDDTTAGTNDYTGTEFMVTFTRVTGANAGCTASATSTATIGDNGQSTATDVTLVDRPTGITARCQYDVAFPTATGLVLQAGATATVSATALAASATYFAPVSSFTPTITINVPDIDDTTAGTNDYTGTTFDVAFTRVTGADAGCTQTATSTATIGDNGQSTATDITLVDRPTGVTARCQYDVAFPTATGLVLQAGSTATVSATALAASVTYFAPTTSFTPTVTITVPDIDDTTAGTNDYSGTTFDVTFTRVTGANAGCTESATSTATIGDNGQSTATTITLVDRPTGVTARCQYDAMFPASATGLVLQAGSTATVSATALAATATYFAVDSSFTPIITITVPDIQDTTAGTNDYSGTTFDVTFTRVTGANAGCTESATATVTIGDNGTSSVTTEAALVDRPTGVTTRCQYDVVFPSAAGLVLQAGSTATVSATSLAASATYFAPAASFTPTVTISVPQTADTTAGVNDYSGTTFDVTFTRVTGANAGCTETATSTATIGDNGQSTATTITLVDRPTGITARCQYDVAFPTAAGLVLQAGATATVSATSLAASATYFAPTSSFTPTITVNVPQTQDNTPGTNDYTGTELDVTFTRVSGANAGCTETATATATIGDDGQSTATDVTLVDRPTGITARCQYDVMFPTSVGDLTLQTSSATVSATAAAAMATYFTADSSFSPIITISVPQTDDNTAGTNDYSGTEFDVTFTRVSGANAGCTESATETVTIGDDGQSTATTIMLVDRPTGVTARCQYDVAFPSTTGLVLQAGATAMVSATSAAATATYFAAAASFTPTVTVSVPQTDDNVAGTNDFTGTEFMVVFTRVSGANAGCTETATSTATIGDNGQSTATTIMLVDRPTGVTARCQYDVAFPTATGLVLQAGSTATVSATSAAATATYVAATSSFTPTVTINVPQTDDNTAGVNDYSGTEFDVIFTRVTGANAGCTESATATVTIGDDGQSTATTIMLVDRPTGITARCQYDVAFPITTGLVLQSGATAMVNAGSASAVATYVVVVEVPPDPPTEPPEEPGEPPEPQQPAPVVVLPPAPGPDIDLVVNVQLADSVNRNLFGGERVAFVVEPLDDTQNPGCTARTEFGASEPEPAVVTLVRVPEGTSVACSYRLVAQAGSAVLVLAAGETAVRELDGSNASEFVAVFRYRLQRTPVRAAVEAAAPEGSAFGFGEVFELHVTVPGVCGSDTALFGGVPAGTGVFYGLKAAAGASYAIGPGSLTLNPAASYTLPAYVIVDGERVDCVVRATEISAPQSCAALSARRDETGRPFTEAARDNNTGRISVTLKYDCAPQQLAVSGLPGSVPGQLILPTGWVTLPFNGPTGTTPQALAQALDDAITSLWIWNTQTQTWAGWTNTGGSQGLDTLTNGDIIMAYSPAPQRVTYTPNTLLNPPPNTGTITLPPRYSQQIYTGATPQLITNLLGDQTQLIPLILRWNTQTQQWNYNLPNRQPLATLDIPWFDTINPGDTLLIYNNAPTPTTIPWT